MSLKTLSKIFLILCLSLGFRGQAVSGTPLADFDNQANTDMQSISDFLNGQFTKSMGFYSTLGWNDNPSVFDFLAGPHLEVGIGGGVDLIQVTSLGNLNLQALQASANVNLPAVLPAIYPAASLRTGLANGLDMGVKVLYLPSISLSSLGFSGNYTGVGIDFRYKIMEGAKLPTVTAGISWDQMQGSLGISTGVNQSTTFESQSALVSGNTNYALNWNVHSFGAKLIVGKDLLIIYPYAGIGFQRNSGTVSSSITGQLTTNVGGSFGTANDNGVTSSGTPVVLEPKFLAGFDFGSGEGIHCNLAGESNGSDLAASIGFKVTF
jgi:hypothetical protein